MVFAHQRFTFDDPVPLEIGQRPDSAGRAYAAHQILRDATGIEAFGTLSGNGLEGVGQIGLLDERAKLGHGTIGSQEDFGRVGRTQ